MRWPPVRSRNRSSRRAASSSNPSVAVRAAASSMASGIPSRRRQTAPVIAAVRASGEKRASTARTRATNKLTAAVWSSSSRSSVSSWGLRATEPDTRTLQAPATAHGWSPPRARAARHAAPLRPCAPPRRSRVRNCPERAEGALSPSAAATRSGDSARSGRASLSATGDADRHETRVGERRELG